MILIVKKKDGTTRCTMPGNDIQLTSASIASSFMSNDTLTITFVSRSIVAVEVGDTITIDGTTYRMNQTAQVKKSGSNGAYEVTMTLESEKYDLLNCRFLLPNETKGDFMVANLSTLVAQVVSNANRVYGAGTWAVGSCPTTEVISQQFTEMNCLAALQQMMNAWEADYDEVYEFRVNSANGVKTINVFAEDGGSSSGLSLAYGHKGGLYSITRQSISSENVVTRLFAYGSTDNIPTGYHHSRLCIKDKTRNESYVQNNTAISKYGIKEGFATFDKVKPRAVFSVNQVTVVENQSISSGYNIKITSNALSTSQPYGFYSEANWSDTEDDYAEWLEMYGYTDANTQVRAYFTNNIVGNKKYLVEDEMTVTFNTGKCAGIAFKVLEGSTDSDGNLTLVTIEENSDRADTYYMPSRSSADTWGIEAGDEFVISDIMLPMKLVEKAEDELKTKAEEQLAYLSKINARYAVEFDQITKDTLTLSGLIPGNFVHITDTALGINDDIKISSVSRDLVEDTLSMEITTIKRKHNFAGAAERASESQQTLAAIDEGVHSSSLTCHLEPNYQTAITGWTKPSWNTLYVSAGKFTNWSLLGSMKEWDITERVVGMDNGFKYDIYIQASKKTHHATIVVRKNIQLQIDALTLLRQTGDEDPVTDAHPNTIVIGATDDSSFYFKIGTISEQKAAMTLGQYYRTINLDFGTTTAEESDIVVSGYESLSAMTIAHNTNFSNLQGFASDTAEDIKRIRYIMERNFKAISAGEFEDYDQTYCEADRSGKEVCVKVKDDELIPVVPIIG